MKFVAARPALATAVKVASAAAGGNLPICNGVRLDVEGAEVVVTCTNLDLTIRARAAIVDAAKGSVIVPAVYLSRFLSAADGGTAAFALEGKRMQVESGEASITLHAFDLDEWPAVTTAKGAPVTFSPAQVADLRKVVGYADASPKAPNPMLRGVHFAGHVAEATDRYRFARADLETEVPGDALVPADALNLALRNVDASLSFVADDRLATLAGGGVEWTTRLIEGEYPAMERHVRAEHAHTLTMSVERLAEAVRRVRILSEGDDSEGIVLTVDGGKAFLRNRETELGEIVDVVPCEGSLGWPVIFRGKFLAELLDNADDPIITFGFGDTYKPIQVDSERLTEVVMPVVVKAKA